MRKYKSFTKVDARKESKSVDVMYGLLSRDSSQANTIATDDFVSLKNNTNN